MCVFIFSMSLTFLSPPLSRYYYADVFAGTPPQKFTVITDTGSSLLAVPCANCASCGRHMDPKFDLAASSTASYVSCSDHGGVSCSTCSSNKCGYSQSYTEGSSLRGVYVKDKLWVGGDTSSVQEGNAYGVDFIFGCHTSENGNVTPIRGIPCGVLLLNLQIHAAVLWTPPQVCSRRSKLMASWVWTELVCCCCQPCVWHRMDGVC